MGKEELSDGPGVTWQELAVGATVQAVMGLLDGLLGGELLLSGGGRAAESEEACQLGDLESTATVEQEVAEQSRGVVIIPLGLAEAEDSLKQGELCRGQTPGGELSLVQPVGEGIGCGHHESPSRAKSRRGVYSVAAQNEPSGRGKPFGARGGGYHGDRDICLYGGVGLSTPGLGAGFT